MNIERTITLVSLMVKPCHPGLDGAWTRDGEAEPARGLYGDVIMEIDWSMVRILDTLDHLGIAGNTLIAFTSDNGSWLLCGDHAGSAYPLREGKMTTFDGGQRVPGIMRWPDRIKGKTVSKEIVSAMDILPTLAGITGAKLPAWTLDGRNILPALEGRPEATSLQRRVS